MLLRVHDLETRRFGVTCAWLDRQGSSQPDLRAVNAEAHERGVSLISTRVPSEAIGEIQALEADGYRTMDILVHYAGPTRGYPPGTRAGGAATLREAAACDAGAAGAVSAAAFHGFLGRYHADPRLPNDQADAAYRDWAERSVGASGPDRPAAVVEHAGEVVGFLALRLVDANEGEVVLNAVHPDHQRNGYYTMLFDWALSRLADLGRERLSIATQLWNVGVQRVWSRRGMRLERSQIALHKWMR